MKITTLTEARVLAKDTKELMNGVKDIIPIVCPSPMHVVPLADEFASKSFHVASQNIAIAESGAYTGETSIVSLTDIGCAYTIIGHSERRAMGETNTDVNKKIILALSSKIQPIVCFGELERSDDMTHYAFIKEQLRECLAGIPVEALGSIILAYEPIWAISSTENAQEATPADIQEMVGFIHKTLADIYSVQKLQSLRLCYGGSVNPQNIKEYSSLEGISGFLVGSAGTKKETLKDLIEGIV